MERSIKERNVTEIDAKLNSIGSYLIKIEYLETALKNNFTSDIKKFILEKLTALYEENKMFGKAGKLFCDRAMMETGIKGKVDNFLKAAECYSKAGNIENAEQMFIRALRDANSEQQKGIRLATKNIYMASAKELEKRGLRNLSMKMYEKLITLPSLNDIEKNEIKEKLRSTYKALGKFSELKLLEGIK